MLRFRLTKIALANFFAILLSMQFSITHAEERIIDVGRFDCRTTGDLTVIEFKNGKASTSIKRQAKSRFTVDYKFYFLTMDGNAPMLWEVKSSRDDIYWYGPMQGYDSVGLAELFESHFVFGAPQSARISLTRHYRNDWSGFVVNTLEMDEGITLVEPVKCSQFKGYDDFST